MTAQKKLILKIVIVMILIVGAPILYFLFIGDNPLEGKSNGTKQIAVVNEDAGAELRESALDFGKEVVPILSTESAYEWSVVSRSTAEKGLANQEYDAILYIPSNFSENIMTYEEQQPVKAEFKYTVSGQLNTANREKVLREIGNASARVNGKISTLYWSYVSQDLEKVRAEFDSILQKEMEFLETISEFYRPNLESVVGDIENQKRMLESILSSINSVPYEGNVEQTDEFQENLAQFVMYVNQYRDFQTTQQQLVQNLQRNNFTAVLDMKNGYGLHYTNMMTYLEEHNEKLFQSLQTFENQLALNHQSATNLSNLVVNQRNEIINLLLQVEGEMLVEYEAQVIQLRNQLIDSVPAVDPTKQANAGRNKINKSNLLASTKIAALDTERERLLGLIEEINSLKDQIEPTIPTEGEEASGNTEEAPGNSEEEPVSPETEEEDSSVKDKLDELTEEIIDIEETIEQIQQEEDQTDSKLIEEVDENDPLTPIDANTMLEKIDEKETEILNHSDLNEGKKERLKKVFNQPLASDDVDLLLEYYGALAQYESTLMTSLSSEEASQLIASSVNKILGINEDTDTYINQLQTGIPTSQQQFASLEDGITTFFTVYLKNLETEYEALFKQLDAVEASAGQVQESLDHLIAGAQGTSSQIAEGNGLVTNHSSLSQNIHAMSNAMNSIALNQQNIRSVTESLLSKAANVNADTSDLAFKWNENVGTTEKYRDDIHDVLNNAFVDGQKNGQIYDHLSTPLSVNSLDPTVPEDKMPPVIVLFIVLISSLLIGYFCYYLKNNKTSVRIALFTLLNVIVGLIISIYGLDIYGLDGTGAIEWTIFTVLLLTAVSSLIFASFSIGHLIGWFVNVAVIAFFVTPMLALLASNIDYIDPMSKVYLSIQYGPESLIVPGSIALVVIIGVAAAVPYFIGRAKNRGNNHDEEATYEA
ncbi:type VII secretion protein EsaA [Ureibacillus acetophenoni]|uniref:Type VII secretion EsaA-like protein n=1 Tax=Ureibacillus acetophenoni TaxID=614649 RepID=A0A285UQK7_9BACL|nr:type VII secretion protein EsaA [Ureibacillus acetophenoni]SOC44205.1 type VII secretion EsaA-like protein [Ureibacillus acetophenoni]